MLPVSGRLASYWRSYLTTRLERSDRRLISTMQTWWGYLVRYLRSSSRPPTASSLTAR